MVTTIYLKSSSRKSGSTKFRWSSKVQELRKLLRMVSFGFGSFHFDERKGLVDDGELIPLSPLQHRMLAAFCRQPNCLLSKEELMREVWNHTFVSDVSLARTVHELRQKLGGGHASKQLIASIYGKGYIFTASRACVPGHRFAVLAGAGGMVD
jgi:hypothetical protein